jgi:hypothetical protein
MATLDFILGDWTIRRGDRLPILGLAVESDIGEPLDLTGAVCTMKLRHQDGGHVLSVEQAVIPEVDGWLLLPAFVYDAPNGVVLYDWPQLQVEMLRVGVLDLAVEAVLPDGEMVTAPSDRTARLVVRPPAWLGATPSPMWKDTLFETINTVGGVYSTLGTWNTSTPGQITGP